MEEYVDTRAQGCETNVGSITAHGLCLSSLFDTPMTT